MVNKVSKINRLIKETYEDLLRYFQLYERVWNNLEGVEYGV